MGLNVYQYFLTAAEELNFSRAADRLYITQQSLSVQIQKLEKQYGVPLFERKPRLRLTLAGERMVLHCRRLLEIEKQMTADMVSFSQNTRGKLTVGITTAREQVFFHEIWTRFHLLHPNISISLVEGPSAALEEKMQSGKLDLYIGVNAVESPGTNRILLAYESLYCLIVPELLKKYRPNNAELLLVAFRNGVDLRDLADLPFILLAPGNRIRTELDRLFSYHGIIPWIPLESAQHSIIYQFSSEGYGVGIISQMYLYQHLKEKKMPDTFNVYPIKNQLTRNTTDLVHWNNSSTPQFIDDFIKITESVFSHYVGSIQNIIGSII